jgi:hypothetical protein
MQNNHCQQQPLQAIGSGLRPRASMKKCETWSTILASYHNSRVYSPRTDTIAKHSNKLTRLQLFSVPPASTRIQILLQFVQNNLLEFKRLPTRIPCYGLRRKQHCNPADFLISIYVVKEDARKTRRQRTHSPTTGLYCRFRPVCSWLSGSIFQKRQAVGGIIGALRSSFLFPVPHWMKITRTTH